MPRGSGLFADRKGLSPVVGVALLVAVTVLLVLVLGGHIFSMAGPSTTLHKVSIDVKRINTSVEIMLVGGSDVGKIVTLNITAYNSTGAVIASKTVAHPQVGVPYTITAGSPSNAVHVVVKAKFNDGSETVLYDQNV